jgi:predicted XRE-type DNA-binding protein
MSPRPRITKSSGNVFADLDLPDAEERLVKSTLAIEIDRILTQRKLTQRAAAALLGIDQPKVSQLIRGRLDGYSTERLMGFLTTLGRDIDIELPRVPWTPT